MGFGSAGMPLGTFMSYCIYKHLWKIYVIFAILLIFLKYWQIKEEARHHVSVRESHFTHTDVDPDPQPRTSPTAIPSDPVRVDFRGLSPSDQLSVSVGQRLSEISFWNLLGLMVASLLFIWSAQALASNCNSARTSVQDYLDHILRWDGKDLVWYIVSVLLAVSLYLLLVSSDDELRIAGTFFCDTSIRSIRTIQVLEGLLFIAVIVSAYTMPIGAIKLAREYYRHQATTDGTFNDGLSEIASMGLTPIVLCVLPWISLSIVFSNFTFGAARFHAITRPGFGSLLSILFWYIPFIWVAIWTANKFINDPRRRIAITFEPSKFLLLIQFKKRED
jgi:hypothetical protein